MAIKKTKYTIIEKWEDKLKTFKTKKKENIIIDIENLILDIKENNLLKALIKLLSIPKVYNNKIDIMQTLDNLSKKKANWDNLDEESKQSYNKTLNIIIKIINNYIEQEGILMWKKNPIVFKLELCKPNLHEKTCKEIIIWIHKVEIKESKLKIDNKKQLYFLIYKYQKATEIEEKQSILLNLLYKIQLYIKNAK